MKRLRESKPGDALEQALIDLYQIRAPKGFDVAWRTAMQREEVIPMKRVASSRFWKVAVPAFAAMVLVAGTLWTGGSELGVKGPDSLQKMPADTALSQADVPMAMPLALDAAPPEMESYDLQASTGGGNVSSAFQDNAGEKKRVRYASISLATSQLEDAQKALLEKLASVGGYVESLYQAENDWSPYRTAAYSLRVPSDKLDEFLAGMGGIGRVTSLSEESEDRTVQYTDAALRTENLRKKMARLQQLLVKAEDVSDLLEIEREISETQYQIDQSETALRTIDKDVDLSAVEVQLEEETPAQSAAQTDVSLGQRLASGLVASLEGIGRFFQNMLVFLTMALPVLAPLVLVGIVVWRILYRRKKKGQAEENGKDEAK